MTRKLRFGIIGCGVIGRLHAEAITSLPDAQLVAVADVIPELAQKLQVHDLIKEKASCRDYFGHL
jgi:UDP-N-acetyl-2-amino-2-deoxyglucuronate dehydrogenase